MVTIRKGPSLLKSYPGKNIKGPVPKVSPVFQPALSVNQPPFSRQEKSNQNEYAGMDPLNPCGTIMSAR
jgi:hypothetical protein